MQYVSVKNLHVGNLKVCDAIDNNIAGIIFLPTSFCVETRSVEDNPKDSVGCNIYCRPEEGLFMIYGLDGRIDVANAFGS